MESAAGDERVNAPGSEEGRVVRLDVLVVEVTEVKKEMRTLHSHCVVHGVLAAGLCTRGNEK